jgi:integrase
VLEIPTGLRGHLVRLARRRHPLARLFPHERAWVRKWVGRICLRAGTQIVCAHAMRGLHSTLAIDAGMTPNVVAFALGHSSPGATLLSYADPNVVARAKQRHVVDTLRRTNL